MAWLLLNIGDNTGNGLTDVPGNKSSIYLALNRLVAPQIHSQLMVSELVLMLELVLVLMVVVVFSGVDPKQGCEGLILSFLAPLLYQSLFWPFANLAFPGVSSAEKRWF